MENFMKNFELPAELVFNANKKIKGKLSINDGLFKPKNPEEMVFSYKGTINFSYEGMNYSFDFKNLGGKYFVSDYQNNSEYQTLSTLINIQKTLIEHDTSHVTKKPKL